MTVMDMILGEYEKTNSTEEELNLESTGTKEKKPKAEISEDDTIVFTERERFWVGMK